MGEVCCECQDSAGTHKPLLLCAASSGTCTPILALAYGPQTFLSSAQAPTALRDFLQVVLPLTHPSVLFLVRPYLQLCLCPALHLAALARWLDFPGELPRPALSSCICPMISTVRGPVPVNHRALLPLPDAREGHCHACAGATLGCCLTSSWWAAALFLLPNRTADNKKQFQRCFFFKNIYWQMPLYVLPWKVQYQYCIAHSLRNPQYFLVFFRKIALVHTIIFLLAE